MKGKHTKKAENKEYFKFVCVLMIFLFLVVLLGYKYFYIEEKGQIQEREKIYTLDISDETNIEKQKLVLKSNFEENRKKEIAYIFEENVLLEVRVLETYLNENEYNIQKDNYSKKTNIEIIEFYDSELKIHYKRLNLGTDEGLSYQEIYDKYMGIIGAYEVIKK